MVACLVPTKIISINLKRSNFDYYFLSEFITYQITLLKNFELQREGETLPSGISLNKSSVIKWTMHVSISL